MSWQLILAVGVPVALILIYASARVAGAAWYKSKQQFDNQPKGR